MTITIRARIDAEVSLAFDEFKRSLAEMRMHLMRPGCAGARCDSSKADEHSRVGGGNCDSPEQGLMWGDPFSRRPICRISTTEPLEAAKRLRFISLGSFTRKLLRHVVVSGPIFVRSSPIDRSSLVGLREFHKLLHDGPLPAGPSQHGRRR